MNVYVLEKVKTRRGGFQLSIDNLQLEEGRVYALVGPNGSGKTTLLNLLGFLPLTWDGHITFNGDSVAPREDRRLLTHRRQVGYLMQNPYLFNTTVYRNIRYGLDVRKIPREAAEMRVSVMAEHLGLNHLLKANAHRLSGGETQRTALARTLVLESGIVLLDEPTANVDRVNVGRIEDAILRLREQKPATIILTTHSENQATRIADTIIRMDDGRITAVCPVDRAATREAGE